MEWVAHDASFSAENMLTTGEWVQWMQCSEVLNKIEFGSLVIACPHNKWYCVQDNPVHVSKYCNVYRTRYSNDGMNNNTKEGVKLRALLVAVLGLYDHIYLFCHKNKKITNTYGIPFRSEYEGQVSFGFPCFIDSTLITKLVIFDADCWVRRTAYAFWP